MLCEASRHDGEKTLRHNAGATLKFHAIIGLPFDIREGGSPIRAPSTILLLPGALM